MRKRASSPSNRVLAAVFFVYVALLGFVAWHHEPWFDEAQAWLIARDSGLVELLTERLRYEGTPGLWHLLLYLPAKLGLPFRTISLISVAIAATTVYLFLRYSPFPWYVKVVVPFGFFTFYQYAVVARSYGLMALLLVSLAAVFSRRNERPIHFFLLLALLANVNAHGFILAGGLAAYHLWRLWGDRSRLEPRLLRLHLLSAAALGVIAIVVVILVWPSKDVGFPAGRVEFRNVCLLFDAFTPSRFLSAIVLALLAVWFWQRKTFLLWAGPILGLLWLFVFKWAAVWHEGALYYHTLLCAWVAIEHNPPESSVSWASARCLRLATLLLLGVHVYWAAVSSYRDVMYPYSGSLEASRYLARHGLHEEQIYGQGFASFSVLPYFSQNIFDNYNHKRNPSYFLWAKSNPLLSRREAACDDAPRFVLVAVKFPGENGLNCPRYELAKRFEGWMFWKDWITERDSLYLYRLRPEHAAPKARLVGIEGKPLGSD